MATVFFWPPRSAGKQGSPRLFFSVTFTCSPFQSAHTLLKEHDKCKNCASDVHEAAAVIHMTEEQWEDARVDLRLALAALEEVRQRRGRGAPRASVGNCSRPSSHPPCLLVTLNCSLELHRGPP